MKKIFSLLLVTLATGCISIFAPTTAKTQTANAVTYYEVIVVVYEVTSYSPYQEAPLSDVIVAFMGSGGGVYYTDMTDSSGKVYVYVKEGSTIIVKCLKAGYHEYESVPIVISLNYVISVLLDKNNDL